MNELNVIVENVNGQLIVSSRVVAEQLGKEHSKVLRTLNELLTKPNVASLIIESNYKDKKGEMRKEYLLTKDGFTLYMFSIQGNEDFKIAYINKFNEMERQLKSQTPKLPQTFAEALKLAYEQQLIIEQQAPKVEYHDNVLRSRGLLTVTEIAKDLGMSAIKLNKILHELGFQYKKNKSWVLYSKYEHLVPQYFDYHIYEYGQVLKIKELGRKFIINLLKDNNII